MASAKSDEGCIVWLDVDEVIRYDGNLVVVDAEVFDALSAGVNETHLVGLTGLDAEFGVF